MKKITYLLLILVGLVAFASCRDSETYADKKKRERAAINRYLIDKKVNVISEEKFLSQDTTTDLAKNQFVLFSSSGVYMQIVRRGTGKVLGRNEAATVLLKYTETNLITDSIISSNNVMAYSSIPDVMNVRMISGSPYAQFESGILKTVYNSKGSSRSVGATFLYQVRQIEQRRCGQGAADCAFSPGNSNCFRCCLSLSL